MTDFTYQEEYLEVKNLASVLSSILDKGLYVPLVVGKLFIFSPVTASGSQKYKCDKDDKMSPLPFQAQLFFHQCQ